MMYMFPPASALSYRGASYIRLGFVSGQRDSLSLPSQGHPKLKKSNGRQFKKCCPFKKNKVSLSSLHRMCFLQSQFFSHPSVCSKKALSCLNQRVFRVFFFLVSPPYVCHGHMCYECHSSPLTSLRKKQSGKVVSMLRSSRQSFPETERKHPLNTPLFG